MIQNKKKTYNRNEFIKSTNVAIEWTPELINEMIKCKQSPMYFIEKYVKIVSLDQGLIEFKLRPYQEKIIKTFHENRHVVLLMGRQSGKALSLDTPILTKGGFKLMGEIEVGDTIYGRDGKETKVTFITETMVNHDCYKVTFDNGEEIIADAEHLWNIKTSSWNIEKTITTQEIFDYCKRTNDVCVYTDISEALEFEKKELALEPRLLGLGVGNEYSKNSIPKDYIFTSKEDRYELIMGFMLNNGYFGEDGVWEYNNKNKSFIDDFRFILSSLGIKNRLDSKIIEGEEFYTVSFSTVNNQEDNKRLYITKIEKTESVPVRCLTVDNEEHLFLCGKSLIPTHNSTITVGYALYRILFHQHENVFILAQSGDMAKELLSKVKLAYENLPFFMQQGVSKWNEFSIWLENGSKITARTTSKNAVRGRSASCIICDEFAFIEPHIAEEFFASTWPTISSGTKSKFFIISTPNGYNHFYNIWKNAELGVSTFVPIKVHWSEVPGRDEAWKQREINTTSRALFEREFECSFDTVSDDSLIKSSKITELMGKIKQPLKEDAHFNVYEPPKEKHKYIITVDTAKGVKKDYSAFAVIKITNGTYDLVAVYRNNEISPLVYPDIIKKVGLNYNNADILIENNEYGHQIAFALIYELEYDNVIWTNISQNKQKINYGSDGSSGSVPGVRTSHAVKKIGCTNLKALIENDKLNIYDFQALNELAKFVRHGDSFQAEEGSHDDIVMCLVLFAWLSTQDYFKNLEQNVGEDIRSIYEDDITTNLLSFGFINDGFSDYNFPDDVDDIKDGWVMVKNIDFEDLNLF